MTSDGESTPQMTRTISRRKMLALTSGAVAGVTGCSSDGGGGTDTPTETGGNGPGNGTGTGTGTLRRSTLTSGQGRLPPQLNISKGSQQYPVSFANMLWTPSVVSVEGGQFKTKPWALLEDWEMVEGEVGSEENPPVIEETISPGFHWWDGEKSQGEEITAEDVVAHGKFSTYFNLDYTQIQEIIVNGEWSTSLSEVVDEYTYRYRWQEPVNIIDVRDGIGSVPQAPATKDPWASWIDRYEDLIDDEDEQGIQDLESDIVDFGVSPTKFMEMGLGHGPYKLTQVSATDMYMELRDPEDHPGAERPNVPTLRFRTTQEGTSRANLLKQKGELDWQSSPVEEELKGKVPDWYKTVDSWKTGLGKWFVFNFNNTHLSRPNVRRAIASMIDVPQIQGNGWNQEPYGYQVGLGGTTAQEFMGQDFLDTSYTYGADAEGAEEDGTKRGILPDIEEAETFMRQAGYERNSSGVWVGPSGNEAQVNIRSATWSNWVTSAQTFENQLKEFGIKVSLTSQSSNTFYGEVGEVNYDIAPFFSVGGINNLNPTWAPGWPGALALGENLEPGAEGTHGRGLRSIVEIPTDISNLESPEDFENVETEEIDLIGIWDEELPFAADIEGMREIFQTLGTYWNYHLPMLVLGTAEDGVAGNTRDFDWPEPGSESIRSGSGAQYLVKFGFIQGIKE